VVDEDTNPFRFKDLSPELRNNVYAHYAQDHGTSAHARQYTDSFRPGKLRTSFHELVFVDKQIHQEYVGLFKDAIVHTFRVTDANLGNIAELNQLDTKGMKALHVTFDFTKTVETARTQKEIMTLLGHPMVREQPRDAIKSFFRQCSTAKVITVILAFPENSSDERTTRGYYQRRNMLSPKLVECMNLISSVLDGQKELKEYTIVLMPYYREWRRREKAAMVRRVRGKGALWITNAA
jgi:hypothetical protein